MTETAARWARVSTGAQDEQKDLDVVDRYVSVRYYAGPEFRLHGKSATKGEHEEDLHAAIERMAAGEFSVIVAVHSDRISRKDDLAAWLMLADAAGGRFEFIEEPGVRYDPADIGSKIMNVVSSHMNWEKIQHLRRQVQRAHDARKARGALVGKVGWGYDSICTVDGTPHCSNKQHDKIPVPTEIGRLYTKDIYSRSLSGQSLRSIARWLFAETGQQISDTGVRQILTNPLYTGRHTYADGTVLECEALVSADMQEQAIKALKSRLRRGQRGSKTEPSLLIPRCLDCGGKAYRTGTGGDVRTYAYYCRTCRHQVACDKLDSIVYGAVMLEASNDDEIEMAWVEGSDSASERAGIKRAMRELDPDDDDYLDKATALRDALRGLPEAIPGHFEERPTGRTKAEAILEVSHDRAAMRELLARWGVAFARDGGHVRVKVNGGPEFRRLLSAAGGNTEDLLNP